MLVHLHHCTLIVPSNMFLLRGPNFNYLMASTRSRWKKLNSLHNISQTCACKEIYLNRMTTPICWSRNSYIWWWFVLQIQQLILLLQQVSRQQSPLLSIPHLKIQVDPLILIESNMFVLGKSAWKILIDWVNHFTDHWQSNGFSNVYHIEFVILPNSCENMDDFLKFNHSLSYVLFLWW